MKSFRNLSFFIALCAALFSNHALANNERELKHINNDLLKYEQQFSGKTSARASNVKRSLKLLRLTRQRLDQIANKKSAPWQQSDKRYQQLVQHLNGLVGQKKPQAKQALKPSVKTRAPSSGSVAKQMLSQQRVRIKKIKRDIEAVIDVLNKGGVKPFQSKEYVNKYKKSYERHQQSLAKYDSFRVDAAVEDAHSSLKAMANMLAFGQQEVAKNMSSLGDVQARLKKIDANMHALKLPVMPQIPLQKGVTKNWLDQLAKIRLNVIDDYQQLETIKKQAHLPNNRFTVQQGADYDMNDVSRMQRGIKSTSSSIKADIATMSSNIEANIKMIYNNLSRIDILSPTDANAQSNHFLGKGSAKRVRASLQKDLDLVAEAMAYAQYLKQQDSLRKKQVLSDKIKRSMNLYEENYQLALKTISLPKAASTDSRLLSIAKKALANKKYGVGQIKKMVINSDKVHRSKTTSSAKFDDIDVSLSGKVTLTGTETTYHYEWDEFQVTTVEPADGKLYLFYNSLKYYTSGSTTTPLNRWILAKRIQGSEIPEQNL